MCNAYLSFYVAKEYLLLLLGNGLVEYHTGERTFKATEKGIHFLNINNKFGQLTSVWPENLSNLT
jgi:predicted transcriptional regulator